MDPDKLNWELDEPLSYQLFSGIVEKRTWMRLGPSEEFQGRPVEKEPPNPMPSDWGYWNFRLSGVDAQRSKDHADSLGAEVSESHHVWFTLIIKDAHGNVLWHGESRPQLEGHGYKTSVDQSPNGINSIDGHEEEWHADPYKALDGLMKRLGKEAGCR